MNICVKHAQLDYQVQSHLVSTTSKMKINSNVINFYGKINTE